MSLRLRVGIAAGAGVLVVVVALSVVVYVLVRRDLRDQIDDSLIRHGDFPEHVVATRVEQIEIDDTLVGDRYLQVVDQNGTPSSPRGSELPVTPEVVEVARGEREDFYYDDTVDGTPVRIHVVASGDRAVQFGRSLAEVNDTLRQLVVTLAAISVVGLGVAVLVGRLVASAAVSPVHRLSDAAETVARTGDLSQHITVGGRDELARLADSFNRMLDALESSLTQQRQLAADASHELRTPLASVRTNIEVLQRADGMDPTEREQLLADVVTQLAELTRLVDDLVELARGEVHEEPFEVFALDQVVDGVVERARRNHPTVAFELAATPSRVRGAAGRVDRAVSNLVDNAAKWSPPGGTVHVQVGDGAVTVTDAGPGIDPSDLPHLFDRFYRSDTARGMSGSGLGLAIVKQVADSHDGGVTVGRAQQGGACFVLHLPRDGRAEPSG